MGKKQYLLTVVLAVVAGFVGGVGSSWFLMGAPVFAQKTPESAKVIQAEKFEVVDKDGKVRARLNSSGLGIADQDGKLRVTLMFHQIPNLSLYDENGETRAGLSLLNEEPYLTLSAKDGKNRAALNPSDLKFVDQDEKPRAALGPSILMIVDQDGKSHAVLHPSGLWIVDQNDKLRASLALPGEPSLALYDENGQASAALGLSDGEPRLELSDKNGKTRAGLGIKNDGEPRLQLADKNEKVIWSAP